MIATLIILIKYVIKIRYYQVKLYSAFDIIFEIDIRYANNIFRVRIICNYNIIHITFLSWR